jgi:hypothetical protein
MFQRRSVMATPGELEAAYRQSIYVVEAPRGNVLLEVGKASPELDLLMDCFEATVAAVITAANPRSRRLPAAENASRHEQLLARHPAGHRAVPTVAQDPRGVWPDEHGILVFGLALGEAIGLARAFGQYAILWCRAGEPVQLLWALAPPSPAAAHLDQHGAEDGGET